MSQDQDLFQQANDVFQNAMSTMKGIGTPIMDGFQEMGDMIKEAIGDLLGKAVGKVADLGAKVGNGALGVAAKITSVSPAAVYDMVRAPTMPAMAEGHSRGGHGLGKAMDVEAPSTQKIASAEVGGKASGVQFAMADVDVASVLGTGAQSGVSFGMGGQSQERGIV